ncbi:MAG: hypothetical protein HC827_09080 [Cyanobacteria bacterium RM1_2_2]|nr:hypothetical protein [Cyanobacteria bacterium RM1_2_2]
MTTPSLLCPVRSQFEFIPEFDDFLDLFPHRGSFLWAEHPAAGDRPNWNTETRHLLTDRLIKQGSHLYGVRFGSSTHYLMLDIDRKSQYHPYRDPFAIGRILAVLEPLGLVRYVAVSSSYSGGIHLYFPFMQAPPSWAIARAATILLENAGFKPHRGQLETFPNNRLSFGADYNGHRLPLQAGSYLLDSDWNPVHTTHADFVHRWNLAQNANPVHLDEIEQVIKQHGRRSYRRIKGKAQKFLNDLNAEINPGWTGFGQTNHLLGKIAQRTYIFHHAIHGGQPLTGERLAAEICMTAESLPGFEQWCRHQHDLGYLCLYWARCVEMSNYYPYGGQEDVTASEPIKLSPNQQRAAAARERIRLAVEQMIAAGEMPTGIRARHLAIKKFCKASSDTLYKNKDFWHGEINLKPIQDGAILADQAEQADLRSLEPAPDETIRASGTNKLSHASVPSPPAMDTDGTIPLDQGEREGEIHPTEQPPLEGVALLRSILADIEKRQRQDKARRVITDPGTPPDEHWFQPLLTNLHSE